MAEGTADRDESGKETSKQAPEKREITCREAGLRGGARVKKLIELGKRAEAQELDGNG